MTTEAPTIVEGVRPPVPCTVNGRNRGHLEPVSKTNRNTRCLRDLTEGAAATEETDRSQQTKSKVLASTDTGPTARDSTSADASATDTALKRSIICTVKQEEG